MKNNNKQYGRGLVIAGSALVLFASALWAASAEKQLEKGINLYNQNKGTEALDYFIDVMVNGNSEQVAEANKYVNLIHNSMGGIQTPVEVDVNYAEGTVRNINDTANQVSQAAAQQSSAVKNAAQEAVNTTANTAQAELDALNAQQMALTEQIEANRLAAQQKAQQMADAAQNQALQTKQAANAAYQQAQLIPNQAAQEAAMLQEAAVEQATVNAAVAGLPQTNQADEEAIAQQTAQQQAAAEPYTQNVMTTVNGSSTFADLTSPDAVAARNLYTEQKIASMLDAALSKIKDEPGVHLYMRDGKPDAIDIDDGVLFNKTEFRPEATSLLNNIYEVLALTQGAQYIILPAGSYTDDVTLAGMREAAALNSYLVKRGISQGKLSYNMGLVDKEAPAQFANLKGLSIVFDYAGKFPTRVEQNENNETNPLLSMAIVPQCHAIDRSLGEAYAIDFSVLETTQEIDNWVLQVVQHGRDGNYYIVRQLEGFAPVYHQILWNGRKGIIGPELPCGKYTIVLTATDVKGNKQTLRRRVVVKCSSQQSDSIAATCGVKETEVKKETVLDYKSARLWKKPARTMGAPKAQAKAKAAEVETAAKTATDTASYTVTKTVTNIVTEDTSAPETVPATTVVSEADAYYGDLPANNPYDMPYDDLN